MIGLLDRIKRAAASDANILVQGGPGMGIECIALLIHQQSHRSGEWFLARNCTAMPEECFESEMFGYQLDAPPGESVQGAFMEADKGTLYLDEIGDLGYVPQSSLFRAIKEKTIRHVGGEVDELASPRLISSTSKDLREHMRDNKFRDDLFYRLATVILTVVPLRESRVDIIPLARHFAGYTSKWLRTLTNEAEKQLLAYDWPGNIRELRTVMERAVVCGNSQAIQASELIFSTSTSRMDNDSRLLRDVERRHILNVVKVCNGNKTDAAKLLGMARSTLVLKLRNISDRLSAPREEPGRVSRSSLD